MQGMTRRNASETAEQQQDWCPNCTKHEPENCRTLPKERVKKLEGLRPKPCETRAKSQWKINARNDLEKRLRNSGTAAGLMPKLYETRARKLSASETREQHPDSYPSHAKQQVEKVPKRRTAGRKRTLPKHSNTSGSMIWNQANANQTPRRASP